jgi:hypothetical protein
MIILQMAGLLGRVISSLQGNTVITYQNYVLRARCTSKVKHRQMDQIL